jgi:hypothetical protein
MTPDFLPPSRLATRAECLIECPKVPGVQTRRATSATVLPSLVEPSPPTMNATPALLVRYGFMEWFDLSDDEHDGGVLEFTDPALELHV